MNAFIYAYFRYPFGKSGFGGQEPYKIVLEEMEDWLTIEFGSKWGGAIAPALQKALDAVVLEGVPVEKALADAEKDAKAELIEQRKKYHLYIL